MEWMSFIQILKSSASAKHRMSFLPDWFIVKAVDNGTPYTIGASKFGKSSGGCSACQVFGKVEVPLLKATPTYRVTDSNVRSFEGK